MSTRKSPQQKFVQMARIGQIFRPGTPIDKFDLFAGRQKQVGEIIHAINQPGQHIIIFGERGVGKTSLSKVLIEILTHAGMDVICPEHVNCQGNDTFPTLWNSVFRELLAILKIRNKDASVQINIDEEEIYSDTPSEVRFALSLLSRRSIIVLDELDRLTNPETTTQLADLIKDLSDHATPTTLILIGVADSVDGLIKEHRSVERALVQVHLPRMSRDELMEILTKGLKVLDMSITSGAAKKIVHLSAGLPHYTHTLALYAAESAVDNDRMQVNETDVSVAIRNTVDKPGNLLSAYEAAAQSSRQTLYEYVLLACALATKSDLGYFSAASVRKPLEHVTGKRYEIPAFAGHLEAFCSEHRGRILSKTGIPRQYRYRFVNPLLQPYVIIHGIARGLLTDEALNFTDEQPEE